MVARILVSFFSFFLLVSCITITTEDHDSTTVQEKTQIENHVREITENPLSEDIYSISVQGFNRSVLNGGRTNMHIVRNVSLVRAAEISLSKGYTNFRILDSWENTIVLTDALVGSMNSFRSIVIRLTDDPNDIDAQWIIENIQPAVDAWR